MSEPKLISPLLDGFLMGEAISCHNGIQCCPAIQESTGEQYIVKIISVPASQVQLAALLLSGAYKSREDASDYFLELTREIVQERGLLADLSRLEGFCAYTDYQVVPMENGVGYQIYLLSPYRTSLEMLLQENRFTHLQAVNLGLDLCTALAASRRAGYLYVDLKPGNIFYTDAQGFRIGDLGFTALSALHSTTLPTQYHSSYTAPEASDVMAVLNSTMDTYALGLILYQVYNGGSLPASSSALTPPIYADYEMSEIILKACADRPEDRWQEPAALGQALVSYMQRNGISSNPIIPAPIAEPDVEDPNPDEAEEFLPDTEPNQEELDYLQALSEEEAAYAAENAAPVSDDELTQEGAQMLAQADDLIALELPEPVVPPTLKPIPVPELVRDISDPALADIPTEEEFFAEVKASEEAEAAQEATAPEKTARWGLIIGLVLAILLTAGAIFGGWYYYQNIYLQSIEDLVVEGSESTLSVQIVSDIDETLLTVHCTDSYGNSHSAPVAAGVAVFHDLDPQTRYNIRVSISGRHKLTGKTTASFTTASQTLIQNLIAAIGPDDGSVLLSFSVEGKDTDNWTVTYSALGVPEKSLSFSGHSVTVSDLVIGAEYTFTLSSGDDVYLAGQTSVRFVASSIVFAQDLTIPFCGNGKLTAVWNTPEGITVSGWIVRCYNENGYDETRSTTETSCSFEGLDLRTGYTVEVFAAGMNQCVYTTIAANPIQITSAHFDATEPGVLRFTWTFSGSAPDGGWIVTYAIGESSYEMNCSDPLALLAAVPGESYTLTLKAADGSPVFGGEIRYDLPAAEMPENPDETV